MAKKTEADEKSVEQVVDPGLAVHGIAGDKSTALSLGLYIVPRGKDTKPDWILAANDVDARRGADLFFGKAVIVAKTRQEDRPSIGARVLVQIPKRDSQPDHLGFIFEEWSKEHAQALAAV